jgi:hypothetical protein
MCCLFTILLLLGPRAAILFWYLFYPARWRLTFDTWIWPLLGSIFLPWTTLMYVIVAPMGVIGFDWLWLGLAFIADLASYGGGGWGNRDRLRG